MDDELALSILDIVVITIVITLIINGFKSILVHHIISISSCISAALFLALFSTWMFQRFFICKPTRSDVPVSSDRVTLVSSDGASFEGIWFHNEVKGSKSILLYFHGNSGNCDEYWYMNAQLFRQMGISDVFIVDYRSFGDSNCFLRPNDYTITLDAEAALLHVIERKRYFFSQNCPIFIYGHSLGAYAVLHLLSENHYHVNTDNIDASTTRSLFVTGSDSIKYGDPNIDHMGSFSSVQEGPVQLRVQVSAAIIVNPFFSLPTLVANFLPIGFKWITLLLSDEYPNHLLCQRISQLEPRIPLLIMACNGDRLVNPYLHGEKLSKILHSESKTTSLCILEEGSHDWIWKLDEFKSTLRAFLNSHQHQHSRHN